MGGQAAALPDALEAVSELLDLSGLFSALLLHPQQRQKEPVLHGGHPGLNFGFPCPTALWSPTSRRTGDVRLAGSPLGHRNADFLELTLAAAAQVLRCLRPCGC